MEEKKVKLISNKKLLLSALILVSSIVIIGLSLTYAYFETTYTGSENVTGNKAAVLNVTTTLDSNTAINAQELSLINSGEVESKAKKFTFSVTNNSTSTVKAKYTVNLSNYSITKNLQSKYFKWKLVVNNGGTSKTFQGTFENGTEPNGNDKTVQNNLSKELIKDAEGVELAVGATNNLTFYVWLENDAGVNQLYLTNGSFSGKLSVEAIPAK